LGLHDKTQIKDDYDWIKPWSVSHRPYLLDGYDDLSGVIEPSQTNSLDALKHLTSWLLDTDDLDSKAEYKRSFYF